MDQPHPTTGPQPLDSGVHRSDAEAQDAQLDPSVICITPGEVMEIPLYPKPPSSAGNSSHSSPGPSSYITMPSQSNGADAEAGGESGYGPKLHPSSSDPGQVKIQSQSPPTLQPSNAAGHQNERRLRKRSFSPPHSPSPVRATDIARRRPSPATEMRAMMASTSSIPELGRPADYEEVAEYEGRVGRTRSRRRADSAPRPLEKRGTGTGLSPPTSFPSSRTTSHSPPRVKVIAPGTPLVGDTKISHTRLIVTKTHTSYPEISNLIPFSSCLLGFHVVFHTSSSHQHNRVQSADLSLHFVPPAPSDGFSPPRPDTEAPVVKAIYPSKSSFGAPETQVSWKVDNTLSIALGYNPYGALSVGRNTSKTINTTTSANFLASGLETSQVMMTLSEDPVTKKGVPQAFDFAVLLYLPGANMTMDKSFACRLDVDAEIGTGLTKWWSGQEKKFLMQFDGKTALGRLEFGGVIQYGDNGPSVIEREEDNEGTRSPVNARYIAGAIGLEMEQ